MNGESQDLPAEPQEWTAVGFLDHFMWVDQVMKDRSFAFLLGAGASISSKIPGAGTLARRWVEELHRLHADESSSPSLEAWATPDNLSIPGFSLDGVAGFYSHVYDRRFCDDPECGYAYLEDVMKSAEPNIGYSILAKVLEDTRHKVVITTNFDNLIADALSIYTDTFPLVCGHESLTTFVRSRLRRPLIAKIHRDLLLAPKSDVSGTSSLDERWAKVLRMLFKDYTPIVIGYGGNDGSLMDFLEILKPEDIQGGIYWCYHRATGRPEERIRRLVARHKGKLIPIVGFDEFMLQLGECLKYAPLADEIERRAKTRTRRYREQLERFQKHLAEPSRDTEAEEAVEPVRRALAATVQREGSWWSWELKAQSEPDPGKREAIYREGVRRFPRDPNLMGNFALFMADQRKNYDEAERLHRGALELDPNHAGIAGNFALFMADVRENYDEAERLYRRALELDPNHVNNTGSFAVFMANRRKDYDEAERLFRRALELDPKDATNTGNFAIFMYTVRKDYDEAERLYRRALELDPNHANNTGNFANFMANVRKDYDEAERLHRRALELGPNLPTITNDFAVFLSDVRKDHDEAQELLRRALELDPNHAGIAGNLASFMADHRKDFDEAERLYRRALELDPNHARNTGNFAGFLIGQRRLQEAGEQICAAYRLNAGKANQLAGEVLFYWCFLVRAKKRDDGQGLARLKHLFERGFERGEWTFSQVLAVAREWIPGEEMPFYDSLAEAILDPQKVGELDRFDRWKQIAPAPLGDSIEI